MRPKGKYNSGINRSYEERLKSIEFLANNEMVTGVNVGQYKMGGQVYWWPIEIELDSGERRKYVMKAPHDTFGDAITLFVEGRVRISKMLRETGIPTPRTGLYDKGTFIQEYVEGVPLDISLKSVTLNQRESLLEQKKKIIDRCEKELGLTFMDNHDGNFIVDNSGRVNLIDLDFLKKSSER